MKKEKETGLAPFFHRLLGHFDQLDVLVEKERHPHFAMHRHFRQLIEPCRSRADRVLREQPRAVRPWETEGGRHRGENLGSGSTES